MQRTLILSLVLLCSTISYAQLLYDDTKVMELRISFAQANWQQDLKDHVTTETDIPATLEVDGVVYDSIGIRYKGNSSYNIPGDKKPFNISMDAYKADQLLYGYKTLNLNNCFKDPTFCREKIAYDLAARFLPAAKAAYVKVFINNVYWGLYLNVQQLNNIFLREWFGNNDGNNYKGDPRGDLQWMGADTARYKANYEKKTNEEVADWSDLVNLIDKLNNSSMTVFRTEIEKVLNVDRALWYLAYCDVLTNLDSYIGSGHNYYIYNNPTDHRFSMIPWDMNEVLGVFQMGLNVQQLEQLPLRYGMQRPLVSKLLGVKEYEQRYLAHLRTLVVEALDEQYWSESITTLQKLIKPAVEADTKKLYTMTMFTQNVTQNVTLNGPGGLTIPGMLSFVRNRKTFLNSTPELTITAPQVTTLFHVPEQPLASDSIEVKAMLNTFANARLWYSINGAPFVVTSMHDLQMNAIWMGATLAPQRAGTVVRYYVEASDSTGTLSYNSRYAEHRVDSVIVGSSQSTFPVVINELLASNKNGLKDPQGEHEDWFELYNTADSAVDLSGKYMTDDAVTTRWKIPSGTVIEPKAYLLIWADEDTTDVPGLHANFKLSKSGEALALYDDDAHGNVLLDSTSFAAQADDVSWGRLPNGSGAFTSLSHTTPGAENTVTSGLLNEAVHVRLLLKPNPVTEELGIDYNGLAPNGELIGVIFNQLGMLVFTFRMNSATTEIDLSFLSHGVYSLVIDVHHILFLKL